MGRVVDRLLRYSGDFEALKGASSLPDFEEDAVLSEGSLIQHPGSVVNMTGDSSRVCLGENTQLAGRLILYPTGNRISVGDWCYIGQRTEVWAMTEVKIGNRVLISHDVNIHDTNSHSLNQDERHRHFRQFQAEGDPSKWEDLPGVSAEPIVIEDDCWLGFGVTVFKGVTIGRGSVIAARSIVTKDVPPESFYRNKFEPVITPLPDSSSESDSKILNDGKD